MCLNIIGKEKVATKDIVVYKHVTIDSKGIFYPLFINGRKEGYMPGYIYKENWSKENFSRGFLGRGAFHSSRSRYDKDKFQNSKDALRRFLHGEQVDLRNNKVVKMIIPKGSKYHTNRSKTLFASEMIYFPIKENEEFYRVKKLIEKKKIIKKHESENFFEFS